MAKYYIGVISLILAGQLVLFTNCSETDFSNDSLTSLQNLSNEEDFFLWLDRYKQRAAELREVNTLESNVLAEELETNIAKLEGLIDPQGSNLPHHDNVVLGVRDYLDASYADGGDLILRINFDDEINKLKQKDIELEGKIAALEGRLKDDLASVKADLEQQIQAGDAENLSYIQSQLATVNAQISSLEAADQDIFRQIAAMRIDIDANKAEIAANTELITQLNVALNEAIQNNQQELIAKINEEKSALLVLITNLENENNTLSQQYTTLSNQHSELAANFITFKMEVEARFARIEDRISSLESRVGVLDETILVIDNRISVVNQNVEDLQSSTASSLQNLKESIEGVKTDTEAQILALQQLNVELKQQISDQEDAFKELMESQREVADLQGKMCTANDSRTKCTGNESDLDSNCCLALDTLNCEVLFADPSQVSARSQCNIIVMTLKNHDEQLQAIKEVDENQSTQIAGLLDDIKNLSGQVELITATVSEISDGLNDVQQQVADVVGVLEKVDSRLLLLEFKASRSEAISALNERSDHYLAWITKRYSDVRNQYCRSRSDLAYNKSDYYVARQNNDYCREKLAQLTKAKELIHIAKSFANGLGSINVDKNCTGTYVSPNSGFEKQIETISMTEAAHPEMFKQVFEKCESGPALAMSMIANVVILQNRVGPDFRSAAYMRRKSKIVQLMYFGGLVDQISTAQIAEFEDIDPTTTFNKDTYYGLVERVFANNYVQGRLRDSVGNYIYELSKIPANVPGLNKVLTHKEINDGNTPYLQRVKALEIEGNCFNCGYKVESRNVTSRDGKDRFSYPMDATNKCPIHYDRIISKGQDGKYYAYTVTYSKQRGATEHLSAYYGNQNGHLPIAESESAAQNGEFAYCANRLNNKIIHRFGMPNTHLRGRLVYTSWKPYSRTHGKPQCNRYYFRCVPQTEEWNYVAGKSPTNNVMHYLTGLGANRVQPYCDQSGSGYQAHTRQLSTDEKAHMRSFAGSDIAAGLSINQANTDDVTQLTSSYWQYKDAPATYGQGDAAFTPTRPILSTSTQSPSAIFFRQIFAPVNYDIGIDQCYDPQG